MALPPKWGPVMAGYLQGENTNRKRAVDFENWFRTWEVVKLGGNGRDLFTVRRTAGRGADV